MNEDRFTPGDWRHIEGITGWRPGLPRMPTLDEVLRARIRFNEERRRERAAAELKRRAR